MIYGTIPAAGLGARLQPLGFSKELSLVGDKAIIEHLLERMVYSGIDKIFVVIDPDKLDVPRYLSTKSPYQKNLIFIVKPRRSLPDDAFAPAVFLKDDDFLYFGLPDTIWYPADGFNELKKVKKDFVFGLFDTGTPQLFDSVSTDKTGRVSRVQVKVEKPLSKWTWGIGKIKVRVAKKILNLLPDGNESRRILGNASNEYCKKHPVYAVKLKSSSYLDIGKKNDYQRASTFIETHEAAC